MIVPAKKQPHGGHSLECVKITPLKSSAGKPVGSQPPVRAVSGLVSGLLTYIWACEHILKICESG